MTRRDDPAGEQEGGHAAEVDSGRRIDLMRVERVLLIKMSAMGDIIHALPVSAALKRSFPHLELYWAVEEVFAPLVLGNPALKGVVQVPKMSGRNLKSPAAWGDWIARLRSVRSQHFDLTIDLQGLTKSAVIAGVSGAPVRLGYHWLRELAPLIERPVARRPESVHIVDQYLDVAAFLGADVSDPTFPLHVPEEDDGYVVKMLCDAGIDPDAPFIAINPASAQRIKEWGTKRYGALIDAVHDGLGMECVLVTADSEVAGLVAASSAHGCVNLARRTNLKQLAAVLRRCAAHVCGDTGSGHIAAAFDRPVVSIVGPTDPDRSCPYGQRENTLSRRDLCGSECRSHHCQFAAPRCLESVTVEEVLAMLHRCVREGAQVV